MFFFNSFCCFLFNFNNLFFYSLFFSDNDSDELADIEPEMDLEIQMAFKEFVKSAKNKQLQ